MLWRTYGVVKELRAAFPDEGGWWSDLQEESDRLQTWADELLEAATHLLNLQLALQSHRTNEGMPSPGPSWYSRWRESWSGSGARAG
jgi:hypothetical protein